MPPRSCGAPSKATWPEIFARQHLRALFDACFARTVAHEEEPAPPRPVDEVIHPWLIRLCSVFLDQGMAYWPMPNREKGFYESVRTLLSQRGWHFPAISDGLGRRVPAAGVPFFLRHRCSAGLSSTPSISRRRTGMRSLQAELLALPGWAGLMRRLEEDPGVGSA